MTSYQNVSEAEISGYNDCPVLDYQRTPSSTSLKTRRRLVSHNNLSSTSTLVSNTSTTSLNGPTPLPKPPSVTSLKKTESTSSVNKAVDTLDSTISNQDLLDKLKQILSLENSLPEREFNHYEKRLIDQFTKGLNNDSQKTTVSQSLENYQNKEQVKNDLIKFMMVNDGVSTWCIPLRKILENIKI